MNLGEPLGLPNSSVRAIVALAFSAVTLFLLATGQQVPGELWTATIGFDGFYFGTRSATPPAEMIEPLEAPYVSEGYGSGASS